MSEFFLLYKIYEKCDKEMYKQVNKKQYLKLEICKIRISKSCFVINKQKK